MNSKSGFTLIELLVVIAILAILAGIVILSISSTLQSAEAAVCVANRRTCYSSWMLSSIDKPESLDSYCSEYQIHHAVCPNGGIISTNDETLICSYHYVDDIDSSEPAEVPYIKKYKNLMYESA